MPNRSEKLGTQRPDSRLVARRKQPLREIHGPRFVSRGKRHHPRCFLTVGKVGGQRTALGCIKHLDRKSLTKDASSPTNLTHTDWSITGVHDPKDRVLGIRFFVTCANDDAMPD